MANGFYLTPAEQVDFLDDCKKDANGNMAYGERAAEIIAHAIQRALEADDESEPPETPELPEPEQTPSGRQPRHNLSDPKVLANFKAKLIRILDISNKKIAAGLDGLLSARYISKDLLKLGKNAVMDTPELRDVYMAYKAANSNAKPSTVNNDPNDYLDADD